MVDIELIKRKLIEAGADPQAVEQLGEGVLESISEDGNFEFSVCIINFMNYLDNFEKYKRKRVNITMAEPLYDLLKYLSAGILDADGRPYPTSYLIEDILAWVLKDPSRFDEFLKETYEEVGRDASKESEE